MESTLILNEIILDELTELNDETEIKTVYREEDITNSEDLIVINSDGKFKRKLINKNLRTKRKSVQSNAPANIEIASPVLGYVATDSQQTQVENGTYNFFFQFCVFFSNLKIIFIVITIL